MGNIFNPDFCDFLQALNDAGVDYLLVGGYAVILHGRSRTTGDMDIWVKPTAENHKLLMQAFSAFGLPHIPLVNFLKPEETDVFSFGRSPVSIDIMTQVKGLDFDEAFAGSKVFEDEGLAIRTINIRHLLEAKRAARRPKDIDDITHLEQQTDNMESNLTEQFQQAVAESKQLKTRPDNSTLLRLYSLYKQATDGDAPAESDAGMLDFIAKAKHNAWSELRGKGKDAAMEEYIQLYNQLKA